MRNPGKYMLNTFRRIKAMLTKLEDKYQETPIEEREFQIDKMEFLIAKYQEYEKVWREKKEAYRQRRLAKAKLKNKS